MSLHNKQLQAAVLIKQEEPELHPSLLLKFQNNEIVRLDKPKLMRSNDQDFYLKRKMLQITSDCYSLKFEVVTACVLTATDPQAAAILETRITFQILFPFLNLIPNLTRVEN